MCDTSIQKWCNYCRSARPAKGFDVWQGKYNKTAMCARCIEARRSRQSADARDAFGKTVTERNATELAQKNSHLTAINKARKQQQRGEQA